MKDCFVLCPIESTNPELCSTRHSKLSRLKTKGFSYIKANLSPRQNMYSEETTPSHKESRLRNKRNFKDRISLKQDGGSKYRKSIRPSSFSICSGQQSLIQRLFQSKQENDSFSHNQVSIVGQLEKNEISEVSNSEKIKKINTFINMQTRMTQELQISVYSEGVSIQKVSFDPQTPVTKQGSIKQAMICTNISC